MITKTKTAAAILALTSVAVFLPSAADAAIVYADGDLILGFRATSGQGASTDYEVNLGSAATILSSSSPIVFNIGAIGIDIGAIFGGTWFNRADLLWSVSGTQQFAGNGFGNRTMFATRFDTVDGPLGTNTTTPWGRFSVSAAGAPVLKINSLGTKYGLGTTGPVVGTDQMESTAAPGALIQPTSQSNSYASFQPGGVNTTGATAFGVFNGGIEGDFGGGAAASVLDLYRLDTGAGPSTFAGNFVIDEAAVVTFIPAGVPEPSSAIALALGGTVLVALRRRRSSIQAS